MNGPRLDAIAACLPGDPRRAAGLLATIEPAALSAQDALRAARLAERAGDAGLAIRACNRALELDGSDREALRLLADIRLDRGELDRAVRLLERLASAGDRGAELELVETLVAAGEPGRASSLVGAMEARGDPEAESLRALVEEVAGTDSAGDEREAPAAARPGWPRTPSDAELVGLCEMLSGRQGVHARQWAAPDGRSGYSPVRRPMTPALVRQHLLGAITLGSYVVRRENTCRFMVFDLDIAAAMRRGRPGGRPPAFEKLLGDTLAAARRIAGALEEMGLRPVLERSGGKGHHVWLFFGEDWPAASARELALGVEAACRPYPGTVSIDVFPAQGRVAPGGLGNLVKLPLGVHQKTGRNSAILDREGLPIADPVRALCDALRASNGTLDAALARVRSLQASGLPRPDSPGATDGAAERREASLEEDEAAPSWSREEPVPCEPPYELEEDIELSFLLERCVALRRVNGLARAGQALTRAEQSVLIYTVGHLSRGAEAVNALLVLAGQEPALVSRLRGHPMSCRKVRARLGLEADADGCDCRFEPTLGSYPHPLLHLASLRAERAIEEGTAVPAGYRPGADERVLRIVREIDRLGRMKRALDQGGRNGGGAVRIHDATGPGAGGDEAAGSNCVRGPASFDPAQEPPARDEANPGATRAHRPGNDQPRQSEPVSGSDAEAGGRVIPFPAGGAEKNG